MEGTSSRRETASASTAIAARGSVASCACSSCATADSMAWLSLSSSTCESGPCSACESRSAATRAGEAPASAITSTSEGPAGMSIAGPPGSVAEYCFAAVTKALPGPNSLSQAGTCAVPSAIAAIAWAPPSLNTRPMPHRRAATSTLGSALPSARGGVHRMVSCTPARRAGTPSISAVEGSGAEPAGTYRPTVAMPRRMRPQRTPGAVSSSNSRRHSGAVPGFEPATALRAIAVRSAAGTARSAAANSASPTMKSPDSTPS